MQQIGFLVAVEDCVPLACGICVENVFYIVRITDIDGHIEYITFAKEYGSKKGQTHPT